MPLTKKNLLDLVTFNRGSGAMRTNGQGGSEIVPANVPRIDYDPVTLQPLGLLVEGLSINKGRNSHQLERSANNGNSWVVGPNTTFIGTCNSPQGTGYIYQGNGSGGGECVAQQNLLAANTNYVVSIWAKLVSGALPTSGAIIAAEYTREDGSLTRQNLNFPALTTEWKKHYVTFLNSVERKCTVFLIADQNTTAQIAIAGFKIEEGTFPTSDIITGATAVARASDIPIIQGKSFTDIWNPEQGTFIVEFDTNSTNTGNKFCGVFAAQLAVDHGFDVKVFNGDLAFNFFVDGVCVIANQISPEKIKPREPVRFSVSYGPNGISTAYRGVYKKYTATTSIDMAKACSKFTRLAIGLNRSGTPLEGHISKFQYIGREFKDSEHLAAIA